MQTKILKIEDYLVPGNPPQQLMHIPEANMRGGFISGDPNEDTMVTVAEKTYECHQIRSRQGNYYIYIPVEGMDVIRAFRNTERQKHTLEITQLNIEKRALQDKVDTYESLWCVSLFNWIKKKININKN